MYMTRPGSRVRPSGDLGREFIEYLAEMAGAFATAIALVQPDWIKDMYAETHHGYKRAKRCIYENKAVCSSCVGLSGNFAIVVCSSFHADLPKSAFKVSFPILVDITPPFSTSSSTLTWCIGTELKLASGSRGRAKAQLIIETRQIAAIKRTRKRRFDVWPGFGMAVT